MAVLSNADRDLARRAVPPALDDLAGAQRSIAIDKPQLLAAIGAIDDWIEANAASFNLAIPQPQRGLLTAKQKAMLLTIIVRQRFAAA